MAKKVEFTLGTKYPRKMYATDISNVMETILNENIIICSKVEMKGKTIKQFYSVSACCLIKHYETYDLLYCKFGCFGKTKCVVVADNIARRQLLTVKKGGFFFLYAIMVAKPYTDKEGKKRIVWRYYALAIQGWLTPNLLDVKKMPKNEDITEGKKESESLIDFIDEIKELGL